MRVSPLIALVPLMMMGSVSVASAETPCYIRNDSHECTKSFDDLNQLTARFGGYVQTLLAGVASSSQAARIQEQIQPLLSELSRIEALGSIRHCRQILQYTDRLFPTIELSKSEIPSELRLAPFDLNGLSIVASNGKTVSLKEWLSSTKTDALLVLHRGEIVYEHYEMGMNPQQRHALWSLSKSIVGLLATDLIQAGRLDPNSYVEDLVPELRGSAWTGATVQQTLDMTTGIAYRETVGQSPGHDVLDYMSSWGVASSLRLGRHQLGLKQWLPTLDAEGTHGQRFVYKSVDTEVMGWVLERVTGKSLQELIDSRLWRKIGSENRMTVLSDRGGDPLAGGGMHLTARDLARVGEMVRLEGRFNGQQILQPDTISSIRKGGLPEAFAASNPRNRTSYSYHNFWWIDHAHQHTMEAKGAQGQHIHVNPAQETVIVKLSSDYGADLLLESTHMIDSAAFKAIADALSHR